MIIILIILSFVDFDFSTYDALKEYRKVYKEYQETGISAEKVRRHYQRLNYQERKQLEKENK